MGCIMEYSKISSSLWMYTIPKDLSGVHLLRGKGIIPMEGVIAVVKAGDFLYTLANPLPPQSDVIYGQPIVRNIHVC